MRCLCLDCFIRVLVFNLLSCIFTFPSMYPCITALMSYYLGMIPFYPDCDPTSLPDLYHFYISSPVLAMPDVIKSSTTFSHGRGCPKPCPLIAQPLSLNVTLNSFSGSRSVFPSLCCLVCAQNLKAGRLQVLRNCTNCVFLTQICHAIRFRYDVPHI